jgi:dihydrodipicolinate synthase/N-acetylneuraminate lyase
MSHLAPELVHMLRQGVVIPAHPLALTPDLQLDEDAQVALTRYYCAAGVGGVAVGVHTTQFEIHDPAVGLLRPVLELAAAVVDEALAAQPRPLVKVAGLIGPTRQAVAEAELAVALGYHVGLLSLAALKTSSDADLLAHCRRVAEVIPIFGFYLQPAVGGRVLSYGFWREFAEIENVVAIKVAPFNRYQTLDVARAVVEAGRRDTLPLYTGNDDNIVADLITPFVFDPAQSPLYFAGGLLGQWAVWTQAAVQMLAAIHAQRAAGQVDYAHWLTYGAQLTEANAAIFDAAHDYRGCIPGIAYVLQQQELVATTRTLNPHEILAPGQTAEIERIRHRYPFLTDDAFVAAHRDGWRQPMSPPQWA